LIYATFTLKGYHGLLAAEEKLAQKKTARFRSVGTVAFLFKAQESLAKKGLYFDFRVRVGLL